MIREDAPWGEDAQASDELPCPRCRSDGPVRMRSLGVALAGSKRARVELDGCPGCRGVWLDAGELQALRRAEGDVSFEKPAAAPRSSAIARETSAVDDVAIKGVRIRCPHCASPVGLDDEDHFVACAYCGSWRIVRATTRSS